MRPYDPARDGKPIAARRGERKAYWAEFFAQVAEAEKGVVIDAPVDRTAYTYARRLGYQLTVQQLPGGKRVLKAKKLTAS